MEEGPSKPYLMGKEAVSFEKFCIHLKISMRARLRGQVHCSKFVTSQISAVVNICDMLHLEFVSVLVMKNAG
jgi:hypothetical protein